MCCRRRWKMSALQPSLRSDPAPQTISDASSHQIFSTQSRPLCPSTIAYCSSESASSIFQMIGVQTKNISYGIMDAPAPYYGGHLSSEPHPHLQQCTTLTPSPHQTAATILTCDALCRRYSRTFLLVPLSILSSSPSKLFDIIVRVRDATVAEKTCWHGIFGMR
jgi:hypothetical protein